MCSRVIRPSDTVKDMISKRDLENRPQISSYRFRYFTFQSPWVRPPLVKNPQIRSFY